MHDCPWFKLYIVDVMMAMDGMDEAAKGRYFSGMIKAWATNNYEGYPFLESQVNERLELRKKKSAAGQLGGHASAAGKKLLTSYPHSEGEDCIIATHQAISAALQPQADAEHVLDSAKHNVASAEQTEASVQQKPARSSNCEAKHSTLSLSLSFFLSFFLKRREECREGKGLSAQNQQVEKFTILAWFRGLPKDQYPFSEDFVAHADELLLHAVDPLAAAITKLKAGQQTIVEGDLAQWLEDAQLCVADRPEERDAAKLSQLIDEIFSIPPATSNGFSWAQHIHSMADIRRLWSQGKIYIGMASKAAVRRAAKASRSADEVASQARKDLSVILRESSFKGALTEAISEYLTDINKHATEKNISELLTSETKSNLFRLWLTENFIRQQQQPPEPPPPPPKKISPEISAIIATKFTDAVAIARISSRVSDIAPAALSVLMESLPVTMSEDERENALMLKLYFP